MFPTQTTGIKTCEDPKLSATACTTGPTASGNCPFKLADSATTTLPTPATAAEASAAAFVSFEATSTETSPIFEAAAIEERVLALSPAALCSATTKVESART